MENFKKSLKQAIVEKAEAVRFEEAVCPHLLHHSSERALTQLQTLDRNEILALINALLPIPSSLPATIREGVLQIVNFGEIRLLANTGETARLFAFIPPQGNQIYQQIKNQISYQGQKSAPKTIELPSDPMSHLQPGDQGHFAMGIPTAAHVPSEAKDTKKIAREDPTFYDRQTASNPKTSVPPLPAKNLEQEHPPELTLQLKPKTGQAAVQEIAVSKEPSLAPQTTTKWPGDEATLAEGSIGFHREEHTDAEDYHFDRSIHSQIKNLPEYTQTFVPIKTAASATDTEASQLHTNQTHAQEISKIMPGPSHIHFGPSVPGETIVRTGPLPIDSILEDMVKKKASDLHLTQSEVICMRIDGDIVRIGSAPLSEKQISSYILPIMPPKNIAEFAASHDTDFAYEIPGLARFRVNIFRDRMGVGAVLRQIPDKILSADDLGLPPAVRKLCELHKGLVVVTGPTGSGKSTTLAAMIDLINESRSDHILTIEDPIEFVHRNKRCLLNQREVHKHTGSFARALRAALREDPDIILIGEMRDLETVSIAIETAETGHLVFGTLHTNTAISTVDRLIDQFPSDQQEQIRVMLAESLKGVVAQTLLKKKGGGRIAAQEVLIVDKAVSNLIREGNTHMVQNHMQTQKAKGNATLNDALINLITKGLVEPKDAYAKALDKEAFLIILQQKGIPFEVAVKTAS